MKAEARGFYFISFPSLCMQL